MEGISREILNGICTSEFESLDELLDCLKAQCTELDPWLPVDDFLLQAETRGYKDFCQLKLVDGGILMGWYSEDRGMFYQCFPTGFEPLRHGRIITHVRPVLNNTTSSG